MGRGRRDTEGKRRMSMTVREIIALGEKQLLEKEIQDAARDSKSLYCYLVGVPMGKLFMEYQYKLQDILCDKYFELIDRRASGEPLQYIVGNQEFMGLEFQVDKRVLIPRMETETLVENALSVIREGKLVGEGARVFGEKSSWKILDLCTGSGAIGISIARLAATDVKVVLSDVSKDAIDVARENIKKNQVEDDVKVFCGDLFSPFKRFFKKQKFDMIVSNPPYVKTDEIETLQKEIREHEPVNALDGGTDGLDFYRRITSEASDYLEDNGVILLEIGDEEGADVKALLGDNGFTEIRIIKDLAERDRVVFGLYAKEK